MALTNVLCGHSVIGTSALHTDIVVEPRLLEYVDHESVAYDDPTFQIPPEPPPTVKTIVLQDTRNEEFSTWVKVSLQTSPSKFDPSCFWRFFAFLPIEPISRTLSKITEYDRVHETDTFVRFYETTLIAMRVTRQSEDLLTDIVLYDSSAVDNGWLPSAIYSKPLFFSVLVFEKTQ